MGVCSSNARVQQELLEKKREEHTQAFKDISSPVMAETNLETVKHNIKVLKKHCEPIAITLSKDAFGHGAVEVAKLAVAQDVDTFIVSSVKEGIELREGGISPQHGRILVFGEPTKVELAGYSAFGLGVLCTCRRSANTIKEWSKIYEGKKKLMTYVMVDAGYIGIGVASKQVAHCVSSLKKCPKVSFQGLVIRTTDDQINLEHPLIDLNQIHEVVTALQKKDIKINRMIFENCPGLLADWNKLARNFGKAFCNETTFYARCSLETFGYPNEHLEIRKLRNCLSLKAQVRDIRKVGVGEWIGLNGGWQAAFESFVGVVSCGFSDGYPQFRNSNQKLAHVRINGLSYSIIGEVCADQILVLLGSTEKAPEPPAKVGDYVTLFGPISEDRGNMDFIELCELAEACPSATLCHISAAVSKSWKSTKVTRRNTLTKMVPKDLKEVKKEVDKELKEQKKESKKAKKGSKKKDEKKKSKRRSMTKKPEKKQHYSQREGSSYEKRDSYIKRETDESQAKRNSLVKRNSQVKRSSLVKRKSKRNSLVKRQRPSSEANSERGADDVKPERRTDDVKSERRTDNERHERREDEVKHERTEDDARHERRAEDVRHERRAENVRHERRAEDARQERRAEDARHERRAEDARHERRAEDARHERRAEDVRHESFAEDGEPKRRDADMKAERRTSHKSERSASRMKPPRSAYMSPARSPSYQPELSPTDAHGKPGRSPMRSPARMDPERMRSPEQERPVRSPDHFNPERSQVSQMRVPDHFHPERSPMRSPDNFNPERSLNAMRSPDRHHIERSSNSVRSQPQYHPSRDPKAMRTPLAHLIRAERADSVRSHTQYHPSRDPKAMRTPLTRLIHPERSDSVRSRTQYIPEHAPVTHLRPEQSPARMKPERSPARLKPERSPARLKPERSPARLRTEDSVSHIY